MNEQRSAESSGKFVIGLLLGLVGTCLLGSLIGAPVAWALGKASRDSEKNRGWNLKPVVVFAIDVEAGTAVTFDMISQRSIPVQFADEAMVTPDRASYFVNKTIWANAKSGDPARWVDLLPDEAAGCFPRAGPPPK